MTSVTQVLQKAHELFDTLQARGIDPANSEDAAIIPVPEIYALVEEIERLRGSKPAAPRRLGIAGVIDVTDDSPGE